jgi:hypothetical protein
MMEIVGYSVDQMNQRMKGVSSTSSMVLSKSPATGPMDTVDSSMDSTSSSSEEEEEDDDDDGGLEFQGQKKIDSSAVYREPMNPIQSVDSSDSSSNQDGMVMSGHAENLAHDKGSNVPFPRLCSATFSSLGQLVYFYSPLPHPSTSKFTAYTLASRNQQPILQSQNFKQQPRTYQLYENYRNFIMAKIPKRFLGVGSKLSEMTHHEPIERSGGRDRKLDYWLDEDDMEDEPMMMYWRKVGVGLVI